MSVVSAALAAGGFTDLNLGLTIWTWVLFGIFAFVLTKLAWKPLLGMIEEREKGIRDAVASAESAREEAQKLLAQHQELIREAGRQREDVMKRALADAETVKTDLIAQARAESDRMLQKAKEQIEREKKLAIQELRSSVADLAVEAAAKIVQSSLTPEAQKKLVHEFIDNLPQARGCHTGGPARDGRLEGQSTLGLTAPKRTLTNRVLAAVLLVVAIVVVGRVRFVSVPLAPGPPALHARLHHTFAGLAQEPREIAFSPDAGTLAVSSVDGTVRLWRLADLSLARTLAHPAGVTSVAFSPDGESLVSGSYDGAVRLWRLDSGALVRTLVGHEGTVWSVAVSPDGERIASSGEDTIVRLWRLDGGAPLRTLTGHALNVWKVAFSPDGRRLASGSFDHTVRVWDVETGLPTRVVTGHTQAVVSLAFSPDGAWLASGGDDSTIILNRPHPQAPVRVITGSEHVYTVAFSPDGRWLASGGRERGAVGTLWKQVTGNRLRGSNGVTVRLWRVEDGPLQQALAEHTDDVWSVAFSPDGHWLASASEDKTVKLFRLETTER